MSFEIHRIAEYPIDQVTAAILAFPGMRLERDDPTWSEWSAKWTSGQHFISVGMSLLDGESPTWGGSTIRAICSVEELTAFSRHLLSKFPGVWMHNTDCEMHTLESFPEAVLERE